MTQSTVFHALVITVATAASAVVAAEQASRGTNMSSRVQQVVALLKAIETGAQEPVGVINPTNTSSTISVSLTALRVSANC